MSHSELVTIWAVIVAAASVFALFVFFDCQRMSRNTSKKIAALLAKHAENMASDDPAEREEFRRRWRNVCMMLSSVPRNGHVGLMLHDAGVVIEREADEARAARERREGEQ